MVKSKRKCNNAGFRYRSMAQAMGLTWNWVVKEVSDDGQMIGLDESHSLYDD